MSYIVTLRLDFKLRASYRARVDDTRADNPETKSIHGEFRRAFVRSQIYREINVVLRVEILTIERRTMELFPESVYFFLEHVLETTCFKQNRQKSEINSKR